MTRPRPRPELLTLTLLLSGVPVVAHAQLGVPGHPAPAAATPAAAPPAPPAPAAAAPEAPAAPPALEPAPPPAAVALPPAPLPEAPAAPPPPPSLPASTAVASEPLAGFSDGAAFLRSPDNDFVLLPGGRLQIDGYFFHTDDKNKPPNNTFLLRRARLELDGWIWPLGLLLPPGRLRSRAPPRRCAGRAREPRDHRRLRRARPVGDHRDAPVRAVRRPVHAGEPHVGQIFRLHGTFDNRAGVRHPQQQRDRWDGARLQRRPELLLRAGRRSTATARTSRTSTTSSTDGPRLGGAVLPGQIDALRDALIGGSFWTGDRNNTLALPNQTTQGGSPFSASARSASPSTEPHQPAIPPGRAA